VITFSTPVTKTFEQLECQALPKTEYCPHPAGSTNKLRDLDL